jgi:hypothetical protein
MRVVSVMLLAAFMASGAIAADKDKQGGEQAATEKRICRREVPTGSRLPKRTCHTATEWAEIDKTTQERADREVDRIAAMGRGDGSGFNPN